MGNCNSNFPTNTNDNNTTTQLQLKYIILIQRVYRKHLTKCKHLQQNITLPHTPHNPLSSQGIEIDNLDPTTAVSKRITARELQLGKFTYTQPTNPNTSALIYKQILYNDNTIYQGTLHKQTYTKEGYGIYYTEDGSKYEGGFHNDKFNGIGRIIYNDGSYYEGEFKDNKQNGYGKFEQDTYVYIGEWKDDLREGKGEEHYGDGSIFKGIFHDDHKEGIGYLRYPSMKSLEGYFNYKNEINGICRMISEDNGYKISIGQWERNEMNGVNLFCWDDKSKYMGEYMNFVKNGFGVFLWDDKNLYEGFWLNGMQHGFGITKEYDGNEWCVVLAEWRFGKEVNQIEEGNEKYEVKVNEINKCKEKLNDICRELYGINGIEDKEFEKKIMNYVFQ